jgi:hypothetical protein
MAAMVHALASRLARRPQFSARQFHPDVADSIERRLS